MVCAASSPRSHRVFPSHDDGQTSPLWLWRREHISGLTAALQLCKEVEAAAGGEWSPAF